MARLMVNSDAFIWAEWGQFSPTKSSTIPVALTIVDNMIALVRKLVISKY